MEMRGMGIQKAAATDQCSVWAPRAEGVELVFLPDGARIPMTSLGGGHYHLTHSRIAPGQCYGFSLDGEKPLPDPRASLQPEGVHGPSCWVDFGAFEWTDTGFQQVPLGAALIYEIHVGTFSVAGTFDGVIEHLPRLSELGVTHVELMPVAHFAGERGWGYDGVCLFAPHTAYGGPAGLNRLVDACHAVGIAVLLDVVYNHLGPSGNYLSQFGPYFTDKYETPWGQALNFDDRGADQVRRFVCDNALHWLERYHIDGLRLDAVHAIFDQSAMHILEQLASEVDRLSLGLGRQLVVIAESGLNDSRIVKPRELGGYGLSGQWSDDYHHALHGALTGERSGYYVDFGGIEQLADALRSGFVFRGQFSPYRDRCFGGDTAGLLGRQFVHFAQNHDQVGNRAVGDRLTANLDLERLQIAAALTLLAPFVPLLFMGEEWGSKNPFQYFTDHSEPELAEAVRNGRRREFAAFGWAPEDVPDPQSEATFVSSKLDWSEVEQPEHARLLRWHSALVQLRRTIPCLSDDRLEQTRVTCNEIERWLVMRRGNIGVVCNLSDCALVIPVEAPVETLLMASSTSARLEPSAVALAGPGVAVIAFQPLQPRSPLWA